MGEVVEDRLRSQIFVIPDDWQDERQLDIKKISPFISLQGAKQGFAKYRDGLVDPGGDANSFQTTIDMNHDQPIKFYFTTWRGNPFAIPIISAS